MRPLGERQKRWAQGLLVDGPLRPVAGPLFRAAVHAQAGLSSLFPRQDTAERLSDVTALIKTFERPQACGRLVGSLRRLYPEMTIVIVDDSREPRPFSGTTNVVLPFDSGVSAGRQAGLARVETPFVLNLDDDFLLYGRSNVGAALRALREHNELDLVGGRVIDLPLLISHDFRLAALHPTGAQPRIRPGTRFGEVEVMDKVPNFFLARTDAVRAVGWDTRLKRLDHADFFTRAKGRIVSGMLDRFRVLHLRDPYDTAYLDHRERIADDLDYLDDKYSAGSSANPDTA